jgi:hypothetical protein
MRDDQLALSILQRIREINDPENIINRLAKLYDERTRKKDLSGQPKSS